MLNKATMASPKPTTIPTPVDFPVKWENAHDEQLHWNKSRSHVSRPVPPLTGQFLCRWEVEGHNRGAAAYDLPKRNQARYINTYLYSASTFLTTDEAKAQARQAQEKLDTAIARLDELWHEEWLPEIKDHLAYWDAFDLAGADMNALLNHMDETLERMMRLKEVHWLAISPAYLAISQFADLYSDLFAPEDAFEAYKLLQGFHNKTLEIGHALWTLSRQVQKSPEIRHIFETKPVDEIPVVLAETPTGRHFLHNLQVYLEEYGQRGDNWGALEEPAWIEAPGAAIKHLKDYLSQPQRFSLRVGGVGFLFQARVAHRAYPLVEGL